MLSSLVHSQGFGVHYLTTTDRADSETFVTALLARPPPHHWLLPRITALNVGHGTITITLPYRAEFSRSPDQKD
jgi:hypothetical protein